LTPDEPSARGPQPTPVVAGTPIEGPPETGALPESLGAALSELLQLALDMQEERSRSTPARHQAAMHRVGIDLEENARSTSGERHAALNRIASVVAESARRDSAHPEHVVLVLRAVWTRVPKPSAVTLDEWELVYHRILGRCLQQFYAGP